MSESSSLSCYHCGEPVSPALDIRLRVKGRVRRFCCYGCQAVCRMIQQEGLGSFYDHRTAPAATPQALPESARAELRLFDDPDLQNRFVHQDDGGHNRAQFLIEGINCAACIWLIEKHLGQLPGVIEVTVNHSTQRAAVVWEPRRIPLSDILMAVSELGYRARPFEPNALEESLREEQKRAIIRLCVAGIGALQVMMLAVPLYFGVIHGVTPGFLKFFRWISLFVATPVVFYSARPFFSAALRDLKVRHLTMDVPVALGIGSAYVASAWVTVFGGQEVYFDSVSMFTFFLSVGRFLEMRARYRAGLAVASLERIQPQVARRQTDSGIEVVPSHLLATDDRVQVNPGETIPVDGIILSGQSAINEAALTGEFLPETRRKGDPVIAGSTNGEGPLIVRVTGAGSRTRLSAIMRILDRAQAEKPRTAVVADMVAAWFVGTVLLVAAIVYLGWSLAGAQDAFDIMLSVLVVTCPCALSLATPTALTAATAALRRKGFLPTRGHTLDALAGIDTLVFDKTGTLTRGELEVTETTVLGDLDPDRCLRLAAALEAHSEHPVARAFRSVRGGSALEVRNFVGLGLTGVAEGMELAIGSAEFVRRRCPLPPPPVDAGTIEVFLATPDQWLARFRLSDRPRPDAGEVIAAVRHLGIRTELLSGDRSAQVATLAQALKLDRHQGSMEPEEKLAYIQHLEEEGHRVAMVGDGINDLPVMAGARVSIAVSGAADLTQLRADGILLSEQLRPLVDALDVSRAAKRVIRQNIAWAVIYNLVALPLAVVGWVPPWLAAIGMSVSSLIVVLNALRLGRRDAGAQKMPMQPNS